MELPQLKLVGKIGDEPVYELPSLSTLSQHKEKKRECGCDPNDPCVFCLLDPLIDVCEELEEFTLKCKARLEQLERVRIEDEAAMLETTGERAQVLKELAVASYAIINTKAIIGTADQVLCDI